MAGCNLRRRVDQKNVSVRWERRAPWLLLFLSIRDKTRRWDLGVLAQVSPKSSDFPIITEKGKEELLDSCKSDDL